MSMQSLERAILAELKTVAKNPKLKMKDIQNWSTGEPRLLDGDVLIYLPEMGVNCIILKDKDRRCPPREGEGR